MIVQRVREFLSFANSTWSLLSGLFLTKEICRTGNPGHRIRKAHGTKNRALQILLLLLPSLPVIGQISGPIWQNDIYFKAGGYGPGYPGICYWPPTYGQSVTEVAHKGNAINNVVTGGACWGRCRNPSSLVSVNEENLTYTIRSNCTGAHYPQKVVRLTNPKSCNDDSSDSPGSTLIGNPCNAATGAKIQTEVDLPVQGNTGLGISRTYSSQLGGESRGFGANWTSSFKKTITRVSSYP